MNYFGHAHVAEWIQDEPAFVFGSMLPDFFGMLGARGVDVADPEVERGVEFHHRTDAVFHGLAAFHELEREARRTLHTIEVPRGPARAAAHVGLELLLDRALLLRAGPGLYLEALSVGSARFSRFGPRELPELLRHLRARGAAESTFGEIAYRVRRALSGRPRLALGPAPDLERVIASWWPAVEARTPEIVAGLATALAPVRSAR